MEYRIIHRHGHFEVCDQNGVFVLSADSEAEALREIASIA